jgi:EAL domain-containing protein (putative c-di-GMP-specific phosphodiesterase class I)
MNAQNLSTAMVLDDDTDFLVYLEQMLSTYQIVSETFESSTEFLQQVGRDQEDLLFLDMVMPGKDGIQVLESLARLNCEKPIVLVTGAEDRVLSAATNFAELVGLQIAGRLHKPFWRGELGVLLDQISEQRSAQGQRQMATGKEIERALQEHRLTVLYQPIVNHDSGRVLGAEAMCRLESKQGDLVKPENFKALAERSDLLATLASKALEMVVADQHFFTEQGLDLNLAVDIGEDQLDIENSPGHLQALCDEAGVAADSLTLELPEKMIASGNARKIMGSATHYRIMGVGLTMDRFGHGSMSEERLYQLPFTKVKIDAGLVRAAALKDRSQDRLADALNLARSTGWEVEADGVDSEAAQKLLLDGGCHIMQGSHLSEPLVAHALPAWVSQWQSERG